MKRHHMSHVSIAQWIVVYPMLLTTPLFACNGSKTSDANEEGDGRCTPGDIYCLEEGEGCGTASIEQCADGLRCVQTGPSYCSSDYIGVCTLPPTDCSSEPDNEVCSCEGEPYRNECEARLNGYVEWLESCP